MKWRYSAKKDDTRDGYWIIRGKPGRLREFYIGSYIEPQHATYALNAVERAYQQGVRDGARYVLANHHRGGKMREYLRRMAGLL